MEATESRPARQRIASRCLVQEDAEGAPRLACCPSYTSVNILGYENTAIAQDYHVPEFMPSNRNPMNPNLSPETKGRLQLQPIVGCLKDFTCEQLSSIEWEVIEKYTETAVPTSKLDGGSLPVNFIKFVLKREDLVSTASMKSGSGTSVKEMNTTTIYSQQPLKQQTNMDFVYKVEKLLDLKPVDLKRLGLGVISLRDGGILQIKMIWLCWLPKNHCSILKIVICPNPPRQFII
ncbi:unnamed protein product [Musa acuminata subsp. malaccensis]|uniref:(wild Malaysian banana) hypothetical protein n=1 Tax=Musa acuminata subsp. malaccensis TaxID=214687 RepID=A0A8D7A500_MUSAM|nr:unnamed protein product [Musa acuminata subsp. malaccensis]